MLLCVRTGLLNSEGVTQFEKRHWQGVSWVRGHRVVTLGLYPASLATGAGSQICLHDIRKTKQKRISDIPSERGAIIPSSVNLESLCFLRDNAVAAVG